MTLPIRSLSSTPHLASVSVPIRYFPGQETSFVGKIDFTPRTIGIPDAQFPSRFTLPTARFFIDNLPHIPADNAFLHDRVYLVRPGSAGGPPQEFAVDPALVGQRVQVSGRVQGKFLHRAESNTTTPYSILEVEALTPLLGPA